MVNYCSWLRKMNAIGASCRDKKYFTQIPKSLSLSWNRPNIKLIKADFFPAQLRMIDC